MEKKEKVMAALAASAPSFKGLSSGLLTCHWLVRKQKPTNHIKAQTAEEQKKKQLLAENTMIRITFIEFKCETLITLYLLLTPSNSHKSACNSTVIQKRAATSRFFV